METIIFLLALIAFLYLPRLGVGHLRKLKGDMVYDAVIVLRGPVGGERQRYYGVPMGVDIKPGVQYSVIDGKIQMAGDKPAR